MFGPDFPADEPGASAADGRPRRSRRRQRGIVGLCFVATLSVLAGMTDAIGFISSGDFVSFMSGNTTRLAIAAGAGRTAAALHLASILLVFVAGNAGGTVVARKTGLRHWPLLLLVCLLLGLAALIGKGAMTAGPVLLAVFAMGALNAAVEHVAGHAIGLTYVTGALSRLGKGIGRVLVGERQFGFAVQAIPWSGMFAGAVAGALLHLHFPHLAIAAAALLAGALTIFALCLPRTWQAAYYGARPLSHQDAHHGAATGAAPSNRAPAGAARGAGEAPRG